MKVEITDIKGNKTEEIDLDKNIFGQDVVDDLLTQYIHVYRSNQRQGTASTKTRAEVSGGGRKPWKQKGTGRARHGSIRSPIWVHGGISHGPKPKSWKIDLPKKMKKKAMHSALSLKIRQGGVKIIEELSFKEPSTKEMANILKNLEIKGNTLIVLSQKEENVMKSSSNIPNLNISNVDRLNVYEILSSKNVIFVKDSLLKLQEKFK